MLWGVVTKLDKEGRDLLKKIIALVEETEDVQR